MTNLFYYTDYYYPLNLFKKRIKTSKCNTHFSLNHIHFYTNLQFIIFYLQSNVNENPFDGKNSYLILDKNKNKIFKNENIIDFFHSS